MSEIAELIGKTIIKVSVEHALVCFFCADGSKYEMYHFQDCCERVWLADVVGAWEDIVGLPVLLAEKINNVSLEDLPESEGSYTWTFYKIVTMRGGVTMRWYGTSNGYYSEEVDFVEVTAPH